MLSTVDVVDEMLTTHSSTAFENTDDIDMSKGVSGPESDIVVPDRHDIAEKSKPVKVSAKQLLSRHSGTRQLIFLNYLELLNYFSVSSANRIALKYPYGEFAYRFHPDVLHGIITVFLMIRASDVCRRVTIQRETASHGWTIIRGMVLMYPSIDQNVGRQSLVRAIQ